jgi:DNA adenine methylase
MAHKASALGHAPEVIACRPIMKWAGGKTQLIPDLEKYIPKSFSRYIEPFVGGGALFFHLQPRYAVIGDSNPELINLYRTVAEDPEAVHLSLLQLPIGESSYYRIRAIDARTLSAVEAAARTLYLNRCGFNGLFRVNKRGEFNVPYGKSSRPSYPSLSNLRSASRALARSEIIHSGYLELLQTKARNGDFVFLDPPYLPIGRYSDFKRYTSEQFYEDDHRELAAEVKRLSDIGCDVVLTNSNHELVHELYGECEIHIVNTKRNINGRGDRRRGQDVIVVSRPAKRRSVRVVPRPLPKQMTEFPSTRYMGSKNKIIPHIHELIQDLEFDTAIDLFSGSGVVSYLFKSMGKRVVSNDHLVFAATHAKAIIENNDVVLRDSQVDMLLGQVKNSDRFVEQTFRGIFFSPRDCRTIDNVRQNIRRLTNPYARALAVSALVRACVKRRPRGVFTYVGDRYDDGRRDLKHSIAEHFVSAVATLNEAVFDNGKKNITRNIDALSLRSQRRSLVYIDPPYFSPRSDNEYVRRYHFVEGLARDWKGVSIQEHTQTKKFKSYATPFSSYIGTKEAFEVLFRKHRDSIIVVSYASNALPTCDELADLLSRYKSRIEVVPIGHRYSFGNQGHKVDSNRNFVHEYLFIGK